MGYNDTVLIDTESDREKYSSTKAQSLSYIALNVLIVSVIVLAYSDGIFILVNFLLLVLLLHCKGVDFFAKLVRMIVTLWFPLT